MLKDFNDLNKNCLKFKNTQRFLATLIHICIKIFNPNNILINNLKNLYKESLRL